MASIGLTENVEVKACILGERFVKGLHEIEHVLGHAILVMRERQTCGEACGGRLVNPDHISPRIPTVQVQFRRLSILVYRAGSILRQHPEHGRATWATIEPHHKGIMTWAAAAFKHPKEVLYAGSHIQIARVLFDARVTDAWARQSLRHILLPNIQLAMYLLEELLEVDGRLGNKLRPSNACTVKRD